MNAKPITVITRDGIDRYTEADLYCCEDCEGEEWIVYRLRGHTHIHLQCVHCDATYCQAAEHCTIPGAQHYD